MSDERDARRGVLSWARPRRWSILVEAVLAVALAAVALPVLAADEEGPVDVVTAYLEAVRAGDVERAETFMVDPAATDGYQRDWLVPEAMSGDWRIESVEQRSSRETYVHAVIGSGGETVEGRFQLDLSGETPLIENPYAYVEILADPLLHTLELGGLAATTRAKELGSVQVALFPGSYSVFASLPGRDEESAPYLAMPSAGSHLLQPETRSLSEVVAEALVGNAELEEQLNADLAAWIDGCAGAADAAPAGCPFSAAGLGDEVDDGHGNFYDVGPLTWEVDGYPRLGITPELRIETVANGWMRLTGTGVDWLDDTEAAIRGRCRVEVGSTQVSMLPGGRFEFTVDDGLWNTCHRGLN